MNIPKDFYVVGIGASAGGLEAIEAFFSKVPLDSGLAYVIIQHLSPDYKSLMPEILLKRTTLPVHTAEDGMMVKPNNIYLIPRRMNMKIFHSKLHLTEKNTLHILNLPIDIFLHSLAEDFEEKAVGVILSGTGSDGSRGVRSIKELGGIVIVQDPDSAKFDGMPKSAITSGIVDFILPPQEIPEKVISYVKHPFIQDKEKTKDFFAAAEDSLTKIILLIKEKFGLDFTFYKNATIARRVERRLTINQIERIDDYLDYLFSSKVEQRTLYNELLIGVTKFFRDTEAFNIVENEIIPAIFDNKTAKDEIRIWVSACSTGEEAYSIAILFKEYMLKNNRNNDIKLFATDVDKTSIEYASAGVYNASITADVSVERLNKFFNQTGDSYKINDEIREMIVFATHNIIKDPPFNKIDLISCRNLLIYFQTVLQQKVLSLFNFALHKSGYLFLGSSESIGEMEHFYEPVNLKWKFFKSKNLAKLPIELLSTKPAISTATHSLHQRKQFTTKILSVDMVSIFTEKLLEDNTPDTVIVNENCEIVNSFGDPNKYLTLPKNKKLASGFEYIITNMVPSSLKLTFNIAINKVIKSGKEILHPNIKFIKSDKESYIIDLKFVPLSPNETTSRFVIIYFITKKELPYSPQEATSFEDIDQQAQQRIFDLEGELKHTKENLQSSIEELETTNEELQSTNEELISANEELQSTNEELQSVNEELYTVNTEFQAKNHDLVVMNSDMENLLQNSEIRIIFLDLSLRIRKFTENITDIFNLKKNDNNRPISDITHNIKDNDILSKIQEILKKHNSIYEIVRVNGKWYEMKIMPYLTQKGFMDGVVISFIDVSELYKSQEELKQSELRFKTVIDTGLDAFYLLKAKTESLKIIDFTIVDINKNAEHQLSMKREQLIGFGICELFPVNIKNGFFEKYKKVVESGVPYEEEYCISNEFAAPGWYYHQVVPIDDCIYIFNRNISERKNTEVELISSEERFRSAFENSSIGFALGTPDGKFLKVNKTLCNFLGYSENEFLKLTNFDITFEEDATETIEFTKKLQAKEIPSFNLNKRYIRKDKKIVWGHLNVTMVFDQNGEPLHSIAQIQDINSEVEAEIKANAIARVNNVLAEISIEILSNTLNIKTFTSYIFEKLKELVPCNDGYVSTINTKTAEIEKLIYTSGAVQCLTDNKCSSIPDKDNKYSCFCGDGLNMRRGFFTNEPKSYAKEKYFPKRKISWKNFLSVPVIAEDKLIGQIVLADKISDFNSDDLFLVQQIAQKYAMVILRLRTEDELLINRNLYRSLFHNMKNGFALHEIILDSKNKAIDYKFIDLNESYEKITGLKKKNIIGKTVKEVIPGIEEKWIEIYGKVALNDEKYNFEMDAKVLGKKFKVNAFSPIKGQFATLFDEI
ncbi:MAG: hypothetical protein A2033_12235 [Bacteroidetes bacterium GWA2_31_9]|nr:MAG: hypothetical protein A2033_12235 [Bacteroidetes bacterium GWA2_31_9]